MPLLRRSRAHETVADGASREQLLDLSRLHNDEVYDRSIDVQVPGSDSG